MNADRLRAVFFDLDGTLVRYHGYPYESSWGAVGAAAGLAAEWDALLSRYLGIPHSYRLWVEENARLLAGVHLARIEAAVFPPPYALGAPEAACALRKRGHILGIVSSGVALVAERVGHELGMHFALANELEVADGRFTGRARIHVDLEGKLGQVQACAARYGLDLSQVAFVGDHLNDIPVLQAVGLGIAYAPKDPSVAAAAHCVTEEFARIPEFIEQAAS